MKYNRIKEHLLHLNKTKPAINVPWLMEALNVTEVTVHRWLSNRAQPSIKRLNQIAKLLGVKPQSLICSYPEISDESLEKLREAMQSFNPCELSQAEFEEWVNTDEYGNFCSTVEITQELVDVLISEEEYEKLAFLKKRGRI